MEDFKANPMFASIADNPQVQEICRAHMELKSTHQHIEKFVMLPFKYENFSYVFGPATRTKTGRTYVSVYFDKPNESAKHPTYQIDSQTGDVYHCSAGKKNKNKMCNLFEIKTCKLFHFELIL